MPMSKLLNLGLTITFAWLAGSLGGVRVGMGGLANGIREPVALRIVSGLGIVFLFLVVIGPWWYLLQRWLKRREYIREWATGRQADLDLELTDR